MRPAADPEALKVRLNMGAVLLVLALLAGISFTASRFVAGIFRRMTLVSVNRDLETIQKELSVQVDCGRTLAGVKTAEQCRPDHFLVLRDVTGKALTAPLTAKAGPLRGSGRWRDRWLLRATCDARAHALLVHVARKGRFFGDFSTDPLDGRPFDFKAKRSPLVTARQALCFSQLGGSGSASGMGMDDG